LKKTQNDPPMYETFSPRPYCKQQDDDVDIAHAVALDATVAARSKCFGSAIRHNLTACESAP
jgi:hypothetical protein